MVGSLMKKRRKSKNIYDKYITLENLYHMWSIIKRTCKNKREVYYFSLNLNTNLNNNCVVSVYSLYTQCAIYI